MRDVILYFTLKYDGDWEKIYSAIEQKEQIPISELLCIRDKLNYNYTSIIDPDYPENLKEIYKPPFSLFWKGNFDLIKSKLISVFGNMTKDDLRLLKEKYPESCFVIEYCRNNKIIIDWLLENNYPFIAIAQDDINSIFDENFTKEVLKKNLLISEFQVKPTNPFIEQSWIRVSIGLSLRPVIKFNYQDLETNIASEIGTNENLKLYSFGIDDEKISKKYHFSDALKMNIFKG